MWGFFQKAGTCPQPKRVPEIQSQTGLTKKFVSLANFHEVLVKSGLSLVNDFAVHYRHFDVHLENIFGVDFHQVAIAHRYIR